MEKIGKDIEKKIAKLAKQRQYQVPEGKSLNELTFWFNAQLKSIIRPRDISDRTSFRRIGNWISMGIRDGDFGNEMFETVLKYAKEAAGPKSRNPAAVFTSIIKKELGYECP